MRQLSVVLLAVLATAVTSVAVVPAQAAPGHGKVELRTTSVSGTFDDGKVTATATAKNTGGRKAQPTVTAFRLSEDAVPSADDPLLGKAPLGRLGPKRSKKVTARFPLPRSVFVGTYHLVSCVDSGLKVPERKETNNCRASGVTIQVGPEGTVAVTATAGTGGTVRASGVSGGSCQGTSCALQPGRSTVTFSPVAAAGYHVGAWTGATCTGYTSAGGGAITFTDPTAPKACTATFVRGVTVSWTVPLPLVGSVSGSATHGTCTSNIVTGRGSCVVEPGVGTVTLTATSLLAVTWTGGCTGRTNPYVLTAPTADVACTANFGL